MKFDVRVASGGGAVQLLVKAVEGYLVGRMHRQEEGMRDIQLVFASWSFLLQF